MTVPTPTAAKLILTHQERALIRTLAEITLIARRNLLLDLRNPSVIVGAIGFSVLILLISIFSFAKVVMPNGTYADYAQFLVPSTIVQGLLFSTINTSTALYNDLKSGMDTRLRTLPIARSAVLAGRIFSSAGRLLIQAGIMTLVGYLLGFRFQASYLAIVPFLILPVIFTSSFAWLAVFFAVKFKTPESVQVVMNPCFLLLHFLSTGNVPKEGFPDWLQSFVEFNPVSSVIQALRSLSSGDSVVGSVIITLLWSFSLTLVFSTLATHTYQHHDQ